ncbi:MAG TPA: hypothetical protein VIY52_22650 [Streptosporangiaceae bacterium]
MGDLRLIVAWIAEEGHGLGRAGTTAKELAGAISKARGHTAAGFDRMPDRA